MRKIFISFICACSLFGGEVISKTATISQDGKAIGEAEILTPIEVISSEGGVTKIKIKGVVSENYQLQIQKNMKEAEIYAIFTNEAEANFKKGKKLEDDYGEIWYEAEGVYEVSSDAVAKDAKALYAEAKTNYEQICSACHRLHEPKSFTANQWPANLQEMINANYVALEGDELNLIIKYLQHNAKKPE